MSLEISNLHASVGDKLILKGISLQIKPGEVHALMGPNGSGKSTLAQVVMGHPDYRIDEGTIKIGRKVVNDLPAEKRAKLGLMMTFQHPIAIPGVSVVHFLRAAYKSLHPREKQKSALEFFNYLKKEAKELKMSEELIKRPLNEGLSGGEKKKMEVLQLLVLKPKLIILDEIDTGTDVDAMRIIGQTIKSLTKRSRSSTKPGVLLVTHYKRIFQYLKPDKVQVIKQGRLIKSGDYQLVEEIENSGYESL